MRVCICVNMTKDFKVLYDRINRINFFLQKKNKEEAKPENRRVLLLVQGI